MLSLILTSILAREWNWTFPSRYHEYSFADAVECDEHLTAVLIMRGDQTVSRSVCESPVVLRSQSCTTHVALSARYTHPPTILQCLSGSSAQTRATPCDRLHCQNRFEKHYRFVVSFLFIFMKSWKLNLRMKTFKLSSNRAYYFLAAYMDRTFVSVVLNRKSTWWCSG
jgi:hypothetical protein